MQSYTVPQQRQIDGRVAKCVASLSRVASFRFKYQLIRADLWELSFYAQIMVSHEQLNCVVPGNNQTTTVAQKSPRNGRFESIFGECNGCAVSEFIEEHVAPASVYVRL